MSMKSKNKNSIWVELVWVLQCLNVIYIMQIFWWACYEQGLNLKSQKKEDINTLTSFIHFVLQINNQLVDEGSSILIEDLDPSKLIQIKRCQFVTKAVEKWTNKIMLNEILDIEESMKVYIQMSEKMKTSNVDLQNIKKEKNNMTLVFQKLKK